jgi:hypothetical protein
MTYMRSWKSRRLTSHTWLGLNLKIDRPLLRIVVPLVYFFIEKKQQNAGRICEKHRITLRTIDTKTQIGTKKERTRNDKGNRKWTRKRITKTANGN